MDSVLHNLAVGCSGVFFGAALFISLVQQPAALSVGTQLAGQLFRPMYRRGAPLQASLALVGSLSGAGAFSLGVGLLHGVGSLCLFLVIPYTLLRIKPTNDRLLSPSFDPASEETPDLLRMWGRLHWRRTALSGLAFLCFLLESPAA